MSNDHAWYPKAKRIPSGRLNPMAHERETRRAVAHFSEGGGTAEWLAHYVNGNANEYHIICDQHGNWAQMVPFTSGSRALLNGGIANGVGCNRAGTRCIQVCVVGYTARGKEAYNATVRKELAEFAAWLKQHHGIPLKHAGAGAGQRNTDRWLTKSGWFSHAEAPGNDHMDRPPDWDWLKAGKRPARKAAKKATPPPRHHHRRRRFTGEVRLRSGAKWPLDKELVRKLKLVSRDIGRPLIIVSGYRTLAEQQRLYDLYRAGRGNLAAYPNPNAPHIRGIAADTDVVTKTGELVNIGDWNGGAARKVLRAHGLVLPVSSEGWHVSRREYGGWAYRW